MKRVLVIHGPNLNLLGTRRPEIYGPARPSSRSITIWRRVAPPRIAVESVQTNHEGEIIGLLQRARALMTRCC